MTPALYYELVAQKRENLWDRLVFLLGTIVSFLSATSAIKKLSSTLTGASKEALTRHHTRRYSSTAATTTFRGKASRRPHRAPAQRLRCSLRVHS